MIEVIEKNQFSLTLLPLVEAQAYIMISDCRHIILFCKLIDP